MNPILLHGLLDRPIAFHRIFAKVGGSVNAGVFLSQAFYWSQRTKNPDGWFYKTQAEWEEETFLSRREQETVRKNLKDAGILEEKLEGIPARLFYRINLGSLNAKMVVCSKLNSLSMAENDILECRLTPISEGGMRQAIICTESTSENTTVPELKNSGDGREDLILTSENAKYQIEPPAPKKRGRPPKPTDPRHREFIDLFSQRHLARTGERYIVSGRDAKSLQNLLKTATNTSAELMQIVEWAQQIQDTDKFCPKFLKISEIWHLCCNWNSIMAHATDR